MTWEGYLELPEDIRAEYVEGEVVVTPPAVGGHHTVVVDFDSVLAP